MASRFVVGIDLGTTNTVVAFSPIDSPKQASATRIFDVEQRVDAATIDARPLLPSVLVPHPPEGWIVGEHARRRSAEVEGIAVASAKSWLAHAGVDRSAAILPWGADEGATKISPIDAQATILAHVRDAWDRAHPDAPLVEQTIVLTVPASFDEVARALTVEATKRAGFPADSLRLFEEPQAAFLDWVRAAGEAGLRDALREGDHADVLVCDVGGGTSDFSLIRVARDDAAPNGISLTRVAVGDHLLLGGDNMDIALAHRLEPRLVAGEERLSPARFSQLVQAARTAKEQIFSDATIEQATVTLLGGGSKLVGGARRTTLSRTEVAETVMEGFFPVVTREALEASRAQRRGRAGLVAFGLPYATDPAVTRHIAAFLARSRDDSSRAPIALLLNGGVFHAKTVAARVLEAIATFLDVRPTLLPQGDPDLAVARGAVAQGLALRGIGRRIGGGSAHGYYVGVRSERTDDDRRAVCVVPRGAEPAVRHVARGRVFALTVGAPARFELFSSPTATHHAGEIVDVGSDDFTPLVPLVTRIEAPDAPSSRSVASSRAREVQVELHGELSEVGTLELSCVSLVDRRAHRLAFELRPAAPSAAPPPSKSDRRLDEARAKIDRVFGRRNEGDPREARSLMRDLEKLLGEKSTWPTAIVRPLLDVVLAGFGARRRSSDHERAFWQLAGFLLRPGYGDPLDARRIAVLEPLFSRRLSHPDDGANWRAWWIAWRRIAGGLSESVQVAIRDLVDPFFAPDEARKKKPKGVRAEPFDELLLLVSSLERVPAARRAELGGWLIERTWTASPSEAAHLYAAIGRIGARVPAYASAHHVVPPKTVETWIQHVLQADFTSITTLSFSVVQLARATGDRARDVSDAMRAEVVRKLERVGAREEQLRMVREVVELDEAQKREMFGEALPLGLRLL